MELGFLLPVTALIAGINTTVAGAVLISALRIREILHRDVKCRFSEKCCKHNVLLARPVQRPERSYC